MRVSLWRTMAAVFPSRLLPHLFEKFWRGQGERGGSGLGLYVAQQFARMAGGEIHAENRTERGARFIVELPVRLPGAETDVLSSVPLPYRGDSRETMLRIGACRTAACAKVYLTALLYR